MNHRIIYLYGQYLNQTLSLSKVAGLKKKKQRTGLESLVKSSFGMTQTWLSPYLLLDLSKNWDGNSGRLKRKMSKWFLLLNYWSNNKTVQDCVIESCETRRVFTRFHDWVYDNSTSAAKCRRWDETICLNALVQFCYHSCTYSLRNARMQVLHAGVLSIA